MIVVSGIDEEKFIPLGVLHPLGADRGIHGKSDAQKKYKQAADIGEAPFLKRLRKGHYPRPEKKRHGDKHAGLGAGEHVNAHVKQNQEQPSIPF